MRTDRELLAAWRSGERDAGSELFERHFDALYCFFRNKTDDGVDDLIQQTLMACLKGLDRFRDDASFRTWLFAIARNELYDHLRARHARQPHLDIGEISVADHGTSPSRACARRREHRLLLAALRSIPLDLQVALELYYWEGLDGPELAAALEVPEGTARSRLRRGRELLATRMEEVAGDDAASIISVAELDAWAADIRAGLLAR